jgi:HTH-type transcriptional regulator / antitoxin HipB
MRIRSINDVSAAVRGRRLDMRLSQSGLAERSGISRKWISEFESGKSTAEFALVLRVLEALGLCLELTGTPSAPLMSACSTLSASAEVSPAPDSPVDLDALLEEYQAG